MTLVGDPHDASTRDGDWMRAARAQRRRVDRTRRRRSRDLPLLHTLLRLSTSALQLRNRSARQQLLKLRVKVADLLRRVRGRNRADAAMLESTTGGRAPDCPTGRYKRPWGGVGPRYELLTERPAGPQRRRRCRDPPPTTVRGLLRRSRVLELLVRPGGAFDSASKSSCVATWHGQPAERDGLGNKKEATAQTLADTRKRCAASSCGESIVPPQEHQGRIVGAAFGAAQAAPASAAPPPAREARPPLAAFVSI